MLVAELLLKILEDLLKDEFDVFKWFLTLDILESCTPVPRAHLQDASRFETVDKLLRSYGEETAVKMTAEVLKKMKMNNAVEQLMRSYTAGDTDTHTTLMSVSFQNRGVLNISVPFFHWQEEARHLPPPPPPLLAHLML